MQRTGWPPRHRGALVIAVAAALLVALLAPQAASATSLPASITTDQTWTAAGSPYTGGNVTIQSGATVTVEPDAVVKLSGELAVNGTLDVNGTGSDPAVFTSADDSAPGQWSGIGLYSSTSSIDHAIVRYGAGQNVTVGSSAAPTITNSTIRDSQYDGIKVTSASPTISGNVIEDNGFRGISVTYSSAPHIYENTISGNAAGQTGSGGGIDFAICNCSWVSAEIDIHDNVVEENGGEAGIRVQTGWSGTITATSIGDNELTGNAGKGLHYFVGYHAIPTDIDSNALEGNGQNGIWIGGSLFSSASWSPSGYPFVIQGDLRIEAGAGLTLDPGTVVKASSAATISVLGDLDALGDPGEPISFTSLKDDTVGGDTNGDGAATSPAPGDWAYISAGYNGSPNVGTATLDRVEASYGGYYAGFGMINVNCSSVADPCTPTPTIRHSKLRSAPSALVVSGTVPAGGGPISEWNSYRRNELSIVKQGSSPLAAPHGDDGCAAGFGKCEQKKSGNVQTDPDASEGEECQGESQPCPQDADPVSLATGALVYSHTDLRLTNKTASPLVLERTYNGKDATSAGFGPGWTHSGLIRVSEQESGEVWVRRADGRGDLYSEDSGDYEPPPGVHDELVMQGDGTFKLTTPQGAVYDFDATQRIASITDEHGQVTSYGYDGSGRISTITDPSSQTLTYTYNASNQITELADSTGREVTYTYTEAGDLDTVTDPLGRVTDYDYDSQRRLVSITDPREVTFLTNVYDGEDRIVEQVDGEGNHWTIDYAAGETTVTEPEGGTKSFTYDASNRLTAETDQRADTTTYTYDAAGNIESVTEPGGAEWSFDHDDAGNLTSATDPEGGERTYTYDGSNHLTNFTDPRDETWSYEWTGSKLTKITDPASGETELTSNAAGQPLSVTDPNGHTTTYTYDGRGNRLTETDPLSHTTTFAFNARNYLTAKTEPGKAAETYTRSALGDLLSVTTPEGNTTSYEYDGNGAPVEVTDPALEVWEIERDGMERPTAYVDPLNNRTEIAYDGNLNPVSVTDRRGETTAYSYDLANRLSGVELPEGGTWSYEYDGRGNRVEQTDPRSNVTAYEYDLNDRMTEASEPLSTTTTYGYDDAGNLTSIADPRSNVTSLAYDELGRMTSIVQPLSKTTSYGYDPAGNVVSRTTAEDALEYSYDDADRLTEISDGVDPLRALGYDDADRLTEATDAQDKTIEIGYDDDDRVVSLDDDRGQSVAREFDPRGNLVEQTDGRGTIGYAYDELSRMTSLTDPQSEVIDFGFDAEGNLIETELPNGVVTTNTYDGDGRMTATESVEGLNTVESLAYEYDAAGNRTSQTDRNSQITTYDYDALDRLVEFDPPSAPALAYGYDAAGNRTSADGVTSSFNALNQLTGSSDGASYDYDGAGRLVERTDGSQTTTYGWDPLDQLTEVDDGSDPITYSYDGLGRRSERGDSVGVLTAHYGDLTDLPIVDTNAIPAVAISYVQGPGGLVEERSGSTTLFPLADAHGDVTAVTDDGGTVDSRQTFDPWGIQLSGPTRETGWLGAEQRRTDPSTGLLQMGIRQYDFTLGRFLSEDPVLGFAGVSQSGDRYSYALSRPLKFYDLDGRSIDGCVGPLCVGEDGPKLCTPVDIPGIDNCVGGNEPEGDDVCTPGFGMLPAICSSNPAEDLSNLYHDFIKPGYPWGVACLAGGAGMVQAVGPAAAIPPLDVGAPLVGCVAGLGAMQVTGAPQRPPTIYP